MKKTILWLAIVASMSATQATPVKPPVDLKAKEALRVIRLAYYCWNTSNGTYYEPAGFLTDSATGKIMGQKLMDPYATEKYLRFELNWSGDNITGATYCEGPNRFRVGLSWDKDRVTGVRIDYLMNFDLVVNYDAQGVIQDFTGRKLFNNTTQFTYKMEFTGDQLTKLTGTEDKPTSKNPWIRCIKTYTDTGTLVSRIMYTTGKSNSPKNIAGQDQSVFKRVNDSTYVLLGAPGRMIENTYNKRDQLIRKKSLYAGKIFLTTWVYSKDKQFKMEQLTTTEGGDFIERTSQVYFSLTDQPASVADYDKLIGSYKFDKQGVLIYEAREGKYHTKVNGIWGDWKFMNM